MNIENYIESQYRELLSCSQINAEYSDLYKSFRNQKLREILMTLHHDLVGLFRTMNERLPTGEHEAHFWAEPSRDLIKIIYVFLTIFLYLLKCPQSLILSALRVFCLCGKPHISRLIFLYFPCQSWLKSW